jgi:branched-chain amino acid transport system substrate-binding protein
VIKRRTRIVVGLTAHRHAPIKGLVLLAAATSVLTAAACSSSSSSSTAAAASTSASAAASATSAAPATSAASGGASSAPAGAPIVIGATGSLTSPAASFPEVKQAETAAVDSINATGGVNGHQLQLIVCDGKFEVSAELGCFRTLVGDHVAAIVGPLIIADTGVSEYKVAQAAGTAVIGSPAYQPGELLSPVAFPLGAAVVGTTYGAIADLIAHGAKKISLFGDANNPAANSIVQLGTQALKVAGLTPVNTVVGDTSSDPTLQTAAAKAIQGGTDGILITGAPPSMSKSVPALRSQGYKGLIATVDGALPGPVITAIGSAGNGMLVASQTSFPEQTGNSGSAQFQADMKKYQPSAPLDFFAMQAWSAVKLFAAVAAQAKATTAAQVLAAFDNLSTPVSIGTIAPYKVAGVTSPITTGYEPDPRMFVQSVQLGTLQNGKFIATGGFEDPFTALKSAS